jgi:hypothetical protein
MTFSILSSHSNAFSAFVCYIETITIINSSDDFTLQTYHSNLIQKTSLSQSSHSLNDVAMAYFMNPSWCIQEAERQLSDHITYRFIDKKYIPNIVIDIGKLVANRFIFSEDCDEQHIKYLLYWSRNYSRVNITIYNYVYPSYISSRKYIKIQ